MEDERWAQYWAGRYSWALRTRADIDIEDLKQTALIGIIEAKKTYDEAAGSWANYSSYFIRKEIRELLGIRNGKLYMPTISLDETIDEEGDLTRLDTIADETIPEIEEVVCKDDMRWIVAEAVERLQEDQKGVIQNFYLKGKSYAATAEALGVTTERVRQLIVNAKRNLRRDRKLKAVVDVEWNTNFYYGVGVKAFNSSRISAVERIVLWREEQLAKCI